MQVHRIFVAIALIGGAGSAHAMPNFSRRENMDCSVCHPNIPRLTRYGYEYRNAGFRTPDRIGQPNPRDTEFGDMNAARLQSQAIWTRTSSPAGVDARGRMEFFEATLYPATGSFGRWWASEGELSMAPGDVFEVENAYLRFTYGDAIRHFNVRAGVFHPWEGYGASDRPVALARPLIQTLAARNAGTSTFFTTWGLDEVGVEGGYTHGPFNVAVTLFNGTFVRNQEGTFMAEPFQGGGLSRPANDPNYNSKDFQIFANYFLPFLEPDAAVSALYYHGTLSVPFNTAGATYTDSFDRLALYGTLPVLPQLWLLGGIQYGWDGGVNPTTGATFPDKFTSSGWFWEVYAPLYDWLGASGRYDWLKPSHGEEDNLSQTLTVAVNVAALNGAQAIFEYQYRDDQTGPNVSTTQNQVRLRIIFIY